MKEQTNLEGNGFKLLPIGKLNMQKDKGVAYVKEDYRLALKHLKLFSHALVFFLRTGISAEKDRKGTWELIDREHKILNLSKAPIDFKVVKLIDVDEEAGVLKLEGIAQEIDTLLFDIKPYFPCEDRVKTVCMPEALKNLPKWIRECEQEAENKDVRSLIDRVETEEIFWAYPLGNVEKIEEEVYLRFNEEAKSFLEALEGFSHLRMMWWFDKFDKGMYRKVVQADPPYENAPRTGVFATRSPVRPNPIALTTVKILNVDIMNNSIQVSELDALDKTSFIALRPYIPSLDRVKAFRVPSWVNHWPEWVSEKETESKKEEQESASSKLGNLQDFLKAKPVGEKDIENLLKENRIDRLDSLNEIVIQGARQNNLRNVNLSIPKNKITVITGVSGSGKSSLAFDTLYAESQRRFVESLSHSSGMTGSQLEKPDVDQICGLPPAIAVSQKSISQNPRSTVGTLTDLYDYLKLLFSKIGTRHCPQCKHSVSVLSAGEMEDLICTLLPGTLFSVAPLEKESLLSNYRVPEEESNERSIFVKMVRQYVREGLNKGNGAIVLTVNEKSEFLLQSRQMCYRCNTILFKLTPSLFSFNNPESMCPVCKGLGVKLEVDVDLIIDQPHLSVLDGASKWWGNLRKHREKPNANWMKGEFLALAADMGIDLEMPWNRLPEDFKKQAIYGSKGKEVRFVYENPNGRRGEIVRPVEGAYHIIKRLFRENSGSTASKISDAFMRQKECPKCHGERLSEEGRLVTIGGTRFPEAAKMTIEELQHWSIKLPKGLTEEAFQVALPVIRELNKRLQHLIDVGLAYLSLDRAAPTLSGGEAQRLRLAAQLGGGLTQLLYILDEPSMGLHPRDHQHLLKAIKRIRDEGNTVVIVEHDRDIMLAADHIIDVGPGAGTEGGKVVAEGTPNDIMHHPGSVTGHYLSGAKQITQAEEKRVREEKAAIRIIGASHHNLKNISVNFPIGALTCVTGVSGSGKSSLVSQTLYPALARFLNQEEEPGGAYAKIEGLTHIDKVIRITQLPIGRTPRSNPATYTGVFDLIRELFSKTPEAKMRGYKPNRFSFNSKEGQCETCGGEGRRCIPMHFMPDVWADCPSCHGKRFNPETLEVKYNELTVADVLDMSIEKACSFFKEQPKIVKILEMLKDVGLGYLRLGQSALTLSGGEAQRIKLAKELSKTDTGKTLYILDEPTTGLHFIDVQNLLNILRHITKLGNTVIVIEHNLDIARNADWIIDLGPEGGDKGGCVMAEGTLSEIIANPKSITGQMLRNIY